MARQEPDIVAPNSSPLPITLREIRLVNSYLEHGIVIRAARDAGLTADSDDALRALAYKIFAKVPVQEYLRETQEEFLGAEKATTKRLANWLSNAVFGDKSAIFDEGGDVMPPKQWPKAMKAIVAGFDVTVTTDRDGNVTKKLKIRFADSVRAAAIMAEWKGVTGPRAALAESSGGADPGILVVLEGQPGSEKPGEFPAES